MSSTTVVPANGGGSLSEDATSVFGSDTQTEDQIIASVTGDEGSDVTTDDDAAVTTTTDDADPDAAAAAKTKTEADDLDPDSETGTVPPELAGLMRDPKVAPHIQKLVDQNAAYRAFGTVRDARAFKETFPGGVKEAVGYRDQAFTLQSAEDSFEAGDPGLVAEWFARSPEGTVKALSNTMQLLQQRDPARYTQITGKVLQDTFSGQKWDLQLASIGQLVSKLTPEQLADKGIEALAGQALWLVEQAEKAGIKYTDKAKTSPDVDEFTKKQQELQTKTEQHNIERANFFNDAVNTDVKDQLMRTINSKLAVMLKESAFSEKGRSRIASEIFSGIEEALKVDKAFGATVKQHVKESGINIGKRGKVVDFVVARARASFKTVAQKVISERTAELIADNKKANERKEGNTRVDITGGQTSSARPRKLTPEQARTMPDSDKDALLQSYGM